MASRHLTLRLDASVIDRLDAQSRKRGDSRSQLVKTLLEEGLRMEAHPGVVFRAGPAGRRPGLAGGPDIWEMMRVVLGLRPDRTDTLDRAAALTGLTRGQIQVAARYYVEFPDDIDEWIRRVDDEASQAENAWQREQDLLRQ